MANFENGFYESLATKADEQKLSNKFHVDYTPEGSTPDGNQVYESLTIETGKGAVAIYRDGSAGFRVGINETDNSIEAYTMIGIDTDSKEFKQFQKDIQKPENYNVQTVEKMLETVPRLTAEKQVEQLNGIHFENLAQIQNEQQNEANQKKEFLNSDFMNQLGKELDSKEIKDFKMVSIEKGEIVSTKIENFDSKVLQERAGEIYVKQSWINDKDEMNKAVLDSINVDLKREGYEPLDYQSLKDKENSLSNESANLSFEDDIDYAEEFYKHNKPMTEEEMAYDEFIELDNDSDITIENHFDNELQRFEQNLEKSKTEIAQPGRTYTGNIVAVDEDKTIQKTATGKMIIHETENLPGIKEMDAGSQMQIRYSADGKGDITEKANDLEIGKEKEIKAHHEIDGMDR